jgi:hypothetical protein
MAQNGKKAQCTCKKGACQCASANKAGKKGCDCKATAQNGKKEGLRLWQDGSRWQCQSLPMRQS